MARVADVAPDAAQPPPASARRVSHRRERPRRRGARGSRAVAVLRKHDLHRLQRHQRRPAGAERRLLRRWHHRGSSSDLEMVLRAPHDEWARPAVPLPRGQHGVARPWRCAVDRGRAARVVGVDVPAPGPPPRHAVALCRQAPEPALPGSRGRPCRRLDLFLVNARQHHGELACRLRTHPERRHRLRDDLRRRAPLRPGVHPAPHPGSQDASGVRIGSPRAAPGARHSAFRRSAVGRGRNHHLSQRRRVPANHDLRGWLSRQADSVSPAGPQRVRRGVP